MTRSLKLLVLTLTLATLLAGCASEPATPATPTPTPSPATPTPTPTPLVPTPTLPTVVPPVLTPTPVTPTDAPNFTIELSGVPASVALGQNISFTMFVNGSETRESDHIGAHYGMNSTNATNETPSTTFYPNTCIHVAGSAPGQFAVNCPNAKPGTYWLRGHMRVNDSKAGLLNFWSNESRVLVTGNVTLKTDIPTTGGIARVGVPFTFNLTSTSDGNFTSDHMGAHWNVTSQVTHEPALSYYAESCLHQGGSVPSTIVVTCTFNEVGTAFLRGHVRIVDAAGTAYHYWASEQTLTIAP